MTMNRTGMISTINESESCIPSLCRTCRHGSYCHDSPSSEVKEHEKCDSFRRHEDEAQRRYEENFWRLYEEEQQWREQQMVNDVDD